jgi:hypothetical protein
MGNGLGTNGLRYADAGSPTAPIRDPRVANTPKFLSYDPSTPYPNPNKYSSGGAPVVLGSGIEARLIEAEAALQANDIPGWKAALNDLRANASSPAIPALQNDSTTNASATLRAAVMFRERAFWLYGTGHRLGDLRRLVRQYHQSIQSTFPIGQLFPSNSASAYNALFYVDQPNLVPPRAEQNANPNYVGCQNRDA